MQSDPVDPNAPLLFLDSGVGGLSVLAKVQAALPHAPCIYLYDAAGFPYGTKTEAQIAARVPALLGKAAERYRPRLVTIACNTASTIALDAVRQVLDVPIVGTVPAIKPAAEVTRTGVIGLLGTDATVRQPYVDNLAAKFASGMTVIRHGAGDLVLAAEAKLRGETPDPAIFAKAIAGLTSQPDGTDIDVIVLACTHFPLVEPELAAAFGKPVRFVDGSDGIARRVAYLTRGQDWPEGEPANKLLTTGVVADLVDYRAALGVYGLSNIERI